MKHTAGMIPIYAADNAGICSALYELGGMTVIHDASGCNSTYTTHDEPRWYDMPSMIYISGLTEMDAILGDDEKLITDIAETSAKLHPAFIALCSSPIPAMTGTDFPAIASLLQKRTGIPCFSFRADGMHSYLVGASDAFRVLAETVCLADVEKSADLSVNLLGATPLDFSVNGSVPSMKQWLRQNGFRLVSCFAMGSTLEEIAQAGSASVNLVVSFSGLAAAKVLRRRFGTPYVVGVPFGEAYAAALAAELKAAAQSGRCCTACTHRSGHAAGLAVVGESVSAGSLACAIELETGRPAHVLCTLETDPELLKQGDQTAPEEDDLIRLFPQAAGIIADPLFSPICPTDVSFYPLPHTAFSGRCFQRRTPNLINHKLKRIL
ncbi:MULTISPECIES: nitrogenase component 1 [Caproicibacterium]|uniref:Oxidoreductase n=2 Tax=Caproicibacterium lactatifermentans TaxID=2666138 RepID=A0A859DTJ6_9FIRM|nr:nitrogenase component 1 [Caproicibacterium lactatifermentans]ARP51231.1 oxidoreductase [Ruminococcaceae bacterium CPB6]QKN24825.1 oxidoreductase [Caproicibacterium lactatifermentans]QKO31190.1 oxidoreductase [Caproicibacterium lactatifermentans]